jgi:hypothetical protein
MSGDARRLYLDVGPSLVWTDERIRFVAQRAVDEQRNGADVIIYGKGLDVPGMRERLHDMIATIGGQATHGNPT